MTRTPMQPDTVIGVGDEVAREKVAVWMIVNGLATGHGDTLDSLLAEAGWQIQRLRNQAFAQGAEAMREVAAGMFAEEARLLHRHGYATGARKNDDIAEAIRAMPLPPPPAGKP